MKGLIFAGCSFTWGQGLYYYSGMETIRYPEPDAYDSKLVTDAHKKYMATLRYPRIVADHFKTWEVVSKQNGGSEETTISFLKAAFGLIDGYGFLIDEKFDFSEIEYVIIQTSQPNRNGFYYKFNRKDCKFLIFDQKSKSDFYEWLIEEKKISIDQWKDQHTKDYFEKLKSIMMLLEGKGIKTKILCWENDYLDLIASDIFTYNRFIQLEYRNEKFKCIRDLMTKHTHLTINSDYENFKDPPKDHHPSKECHEVMAYAVIKSIEKDLSAKENSNFSVLIQDHSIENIDDNEVNKKQSRSII